MARWIPSEPGEEEGLLRELGISSAEELFADVPRQVRIGRMGVGAARDESEVVALVDKILAHNRTYSKVPTFLGGRIPIRYLPAAVDAVLLRSEFYTSYTPYQPEASQGMLQSLFEFQSLWVELTGLDAANASMYDGSTAAGEALLLAHRVHPGKRFLVPASLPWEEKSVLANYAVGPGLRIEEVAFDARTGGLDLDAVRTAVRSGDVCGVLADLPNGFGVVDAGLPELRSTIGDVPLVVSADPLALSVLEPPGSWGADIVVGEGQGFGAPPSFGGPLLGLFACRREYLRLAPGRIVGATKDSAGRRAFTLTLQTREQHIRRSRATSNICTNQSLLALAFTTYASLVGPRGLAALAGRLNERARGLASALGAIPGLRAPAFEAPYLWEFCVELPGGNAGKFLDAVRRRRVIGGSLLTDPREPSKATGRELFLTGATELTDDKAIAKYARAARASIGSVGAGS
ncbi:MAG TPA: aminomethyl-transferring glycine dehydrogenase subunit GcvPA [Thermoplasmata archaeon]|nr:aminomethyl-transferring glycine dehydrogenase subunit GcvPA [Thermoplasmata archaeon]